MLLKSPYTQAEEACEEISCQAAGWNDLDRIVIPKEPHNYSLEYQLLDRCKQDCKYYLGYGNRQAKYLWGGTVEAHIAKMFDLYAVLPEKPVWLSLSDINRYAEQMTKSE